jgi:LysR family transcriptional regulator, glycine cleavage system transcriptional activator
MNAPPQHPLPLVGLRAFDAVARNLSFGAAAQELFVTQPAISRQIQSLESSLGAPLFDRGTRKVELTAAGAELQKLVTPWLSRLDSTVRQIRQARGRNTVSLTTFASFASLWLIPKLHEFQAQHPAIDIRISAADTLASTEQRDIDLALRYQHPDRVPPGAIALFGEAVSPVVSPAYLQACAEGRLPPLRTPADLAQHVLLEEDDARPSAVYLSWRRWLQRHVGGDVQPRAWLYLNFTYQQVQAALAGQGVALGRLPLVAESLQRGELVEPFGPACRDTSVYRYWLLPWPQRQANPGLAAFEAWLLAKAAQTRAAGSARARAPARAKRR